MLLRQDCCRAEDHDLLAILRRLEGCAQGDLGFAETDVAADETVHRAAMLRMSAFTSAMAASWSGVSSIGERLLHLALRRRCPGRTLKPCVARAARVHVDQVECELLCRLARLCSWHATSRDVFSLVRRGLAALGAHVARHAIELLDRHEQLIAFRVLPTAGSRAPCRRSHAVQGPRRSATPWAAWTT